MSDFKGKNVLVTGSSKGIGRDIAITFAAQGANVAIHYNTDKEGANETKAKVDKYNNNSIILKADVSSSKDVNKMFEVYFNKYKKIDILVNNAGGGLRKPFLEINEEEWDRILNRNLKSVFLCSQIAARNMVENKTGGSIVSISSQAAYAAIDCNAIYCTAKGGVNLLTKAMACELAQFKIRVNAIAPGTINVERNVKNDPNFHCNWKPFIPLGRVGETREIADVVLFLSSEKASFITGQTMYVEGGGLSYVPSPGLNFAK
jgi:glucose 1-dehydrogenase